MNALNIVILAAGKGTRMYSEKPKVLHALAGKPLVQHVLDCAAALQPRQVCVVYGHGGEAVPEAMQQYPAKFVLQEPQLGTGHATAQAVPFITADTVLILYGDVPLIEVETLQRLLKHVVPGQMGLLTVELDDPTGYGRIVRDADGKLLPDPLEIGVLAQGRLLDAALAAVPASTPAVELYPLVLAGDGKQSVFLREADYVSNMLASRFGARGQVRLVNHRDHIADRPLATRESLRRAVQTLAERSGPEDLVFIYLTSHGTHEHELVLDQPRMELADLPADELTAVLAPLKNRDKIVVISACYSGGFIPALKDEHTLIMTASRADRVSFGCSEEADFTYFGDALFAQAFNQTDDLQQAFKLAQLHVTEREQADNFEASEPQIWAPKGVIAHWQLLRKQQARKALESVSLNSKEAKGN